MLDPQLLRSDIEGIAKRLLDTRGVHLNVETFKNYEKRRKVVQVEKETLQAQVNATSTQVGIFKAQGDHGKVAELIQNASSEAEKRKALDIEYAEIETKLKELSL